MVKMRLYVAVALAAMAAGAAGETGCRKAASTAPMNVPTAPTNTPATGTNIVSVAIVPGQSIVSVPGEVTALTVVANVTNGTLDVTSRAVWSTDNRLVATVDSNGVVTAIGYGAATISATLPTLPNVAPPQPVEIDVVDKSKVAGSYRLTFNASKSCRLPSQAMSRSYDAAISLTNGRIKIVLSGANFWTGPGTIQWNTIYVELHPDSVTFKVFDIDFAFYEGGGIVEQLADNEYLAFYGTGQAPALTPSFSVAFAGTVSIVAPPLISDTYGVIATCAAPDHQLVFTRTSSVSTVRSLSLDASKSRQKSR